MTGWVLHPQLAADTHPLARLPLCEVRLMRDARFPWLVLVPRIEGAVDWVDLPREVQHRLIDEIDLAGHALRAVAAFDKLNIAALGNVVAQLHVHVVGRSAGDAAWPRPVWGSGPAADYDSDALRTLSAALEAALRAPAAGADALA